MAQAVSDGDTLYVVRRDGRRYWVDRVREGTETVAGPLPWQRALEVGWECVRCHQRRGQRADLVVRSGGAEQLSFGPQPRPTRFYRALMAALKCHTLSCVAVYVGTTPGAVRRWIAGEAVPKGQAWEGRKRPTELTRQFREMAEVRDCPCCDVLLRARWLAGFGPHVAPKIQQE